MADELTYETTRDVLRAALELHSTHEGPTARESLEITIRMECARAGLPKPDLNHFPPSEIADQYMTAIEAVGAEAAARPHRGWSEESLG